MFDEAMEVFVVYIRTAIKRLMVGTVRMLVCMKYAGHFNGDMPTLVNMEHHAVVQAETARQQNAEANGETGNIA